MPGCGEKLARLTSGSQYRCLYAGECIQMLTSGACITYNQHAGGCNRMLKVLLHGSAHTTAHTVLSVSTGHGSHFTPRACRDVPCTVPGKTFPGVFFSPPVSRMTSMM